MNTYFYMEGRIFETLSKAQFFRKLNCPNGKIDEIYTNKTFKEFENNFENYKNQGESDFNAIELSK